MAAEIILITVEVVEIIKIIKRICAVSVTSAVLFSSFCTGAFADYIKWVDFTPTAAAIAEAAEEDISSHEGEAPVSMCALLALYASRKGGDFSHYKRGDISSLAKECAGVDPGALAENSKLYEYYESCYLAALGGVVGNRTVYTANADGTYTAEHGYGYTVYSPIADGYYYSHYDDFGASRSFGYKREHLGHDLMGSVGTPIIAVESGWVEACGWNRFGGWRIGIRSHDGKRYYYYAHLRRDHPYNDMYEGKEVYAGEVIGYLGMTGYSSKENVNNINVPHLHYGLELIFDKSQKDGNNQIWLDMYALTDFLFRHRAPTASRDGERYSLSYCVPDNVPD